MAFTDLIIEVPEVISKELCTEIIDRFEADNSKTAGITGGIGYNEQVKRSTDLMITDLPDWTDIDQKFYDALSPHFQDYLATYGDVIGTNLHGVGFHDMGYQIQRTNPGEFYHWHHDYNIAPVPGTFHMNRHNEGMVYCKERLFTYIVYLNDRTDYQEDGRTQFTHCGETFSYIAEPGKLLLFPANIIYTHRGETLQNGVKYLMTGWAGFYSAMNLASASASDIQNLQEIIDSSDEFTRFDGQFT